MSDLKATIYHNPRCSKSRSSLQILNEHNVATDEVRYLQTPPSKQELAELCRLMGLKPAQIVRRGETVFKELDLAEAQLTDDEWLDILIANPILIERPIVKIGDKAVMGRPPENVLQLLQ
ncbi:arsenate reductase (glutaredoxin) [Thiomicrorhabdus sediminis]|uniref:Arsenate reductase n=1 Tax=Thiomicrorhabdus sediminis TaxID=2580412 RepID=A0A4P9K585_9GAMM|nr:arsenate reductase (glutaredoxin) [Thiomicrorhabdus sediminis]QCU90129.1 arsenate reductase (glutaredoxin) [Thiomicrorhabdus sediminis]